MTNDMSVEQVKAICEKLECSPSSNSKPAGSGGKPSLTRHASNFAASGSTGTLDRAYRGKPGYKGKYAKGARQE